MEITFALYGPRKALIALTAIILDDENVESYEIHKDVDSAGYAYITLEGEDLQLDTYEAIENAAGVTYEKEVAA